MSVFLNTTSASHPGKVNNEYCPRMQPVNVIVAGTKAKRANANTADCEHD